MFLTDLYRDRYLLDRPELARGTKQNITATIRTFEKFLGHRPGLADLSRPTIYDFMGWCAERRGFAPKTINNKRGDLLTLWYCAEEAGLLAPPPRIRKRREPVRLPVVWSLAEIRVLYAATDRLHGWFHGIRKSLLGKLTLSLLWDTGSRIGTLRLARLAHVDLARGTWFVPAENIKGKVADRLYRIHADTASLLKQSLPPSRELLVPLPSDRNTLYGWMRSLLSLAGLPHDRLHQFHCIRRTAETQAAAKNGISWAASAVGHTEAVAKKHYINPAYLPDAPCLIEALPRLDVR